MRAFPFALRGIAVAGALALAVTSGAQAIDTDQSAAEIQIRLVEARQNLNSLYAQAAVASERLNGAVYEAEQAEAEVARNTKAVTAAEKDLKRQREAVAALTVQDLQSGTGMSRLTTLIESDGPGQLLDRSAAYSSTQEAMAARIDALSASTVVFDSAKHRATEAQEKQKAALARRVAAKAAITAAIAKAEAAVAQTTAERAVLLRELANAEGTSLEKVTERQDDIDRDLDAQPGTPLPPGDSDDPSVPDPDPEDPKPTKPVPTTPKPTTPPKPPEPPTPPPASGSKVDKAINFAKSQLGDPYKWGGTGPNSWDCSGLTMKAYAAAGVNLPHWGVAQYRETTKVSVSKIQRGDLLFWSNGSSGSIYHVALYLGGGQMIHAPRTGRDVEIVSINYWIRPDLASRPG